MADPRPLSEWNEEDGDVLWWRFPIEEPPYVGTPLDLGHTFEIIARYIDQGQLVEKLQRQLVGGWPGYHTHWTPIECPSEPHPPPPR